MDNLIERLVRIEEKQDSLIEKIHTTEERILKIVETHDEKLSSLIAIKNYAIGVFTVVGAVTIFVVQKITGVFTLGDKS